MKRLLVGALLGVGASLIAAPSTGARPRPAANAKRLSVLDYYFLLPYIGNVPTGMSKGVIKRQRLELLQAENKPVVDLSHDYLQVNPDSSPTAQITVFRGGSADVVAYSDPDYRSDYNSFALYQLKSGKLRDVTEKLLPVPSRTDGFLYELPRVGTTIRVFSFNLNSQSRKPAFDLLWRRGRFVKTNLKRAAHRKGR